MALTKKCCVDWVGLDGSRLEELEFGLGFVAGCWMWLVRAGFWTEAELV